MLTYFKSAYFGRACTVFTLTNKGVIIIITQIDKSIVIHLFVFGSAEFSVFVGIEPIYNFGTECAVECPLNIRSAQIFSVPYKFNRIVYKYVRMSVQKK